MWTVGVPHALLLTGSQHISSNSGTRTPANHNTRTCASHHSDCSCCAVRRTDARRPWGKAAEHATYTTRQVNTVLPLHHTVWRSQSLRSAPAQKHAGSRAKPRPAPGAPGVQQHPGPARPQRPWRCRRAYPRGPRVGALSARLPRTSWTPGQRRLRARRPARPARHSRPPPRPAPPVLASCGPTIRIGCSAQAVLAQAVLERCECYQ